MLFKLITIQLILTNIAKELCWSQINFVIGKINLSYIKLINNNSKYDCILFSQELLKLDNMIQFKNKLPCVGRTYYSVSFNNFNLLH